MHNRMVILVVAIALLGGACSQLGSGGDVLGYPDVDLDADRIVEFRSSEQRTLHLHLFLPESVSATGIVLFFHGGGYAETRVPQFEPQARFLSEAGIAAALVEYRVSAEGASQTDAHTDGAAAVRYVIDNSDELGVDPTRVAIAGSSAGGHLATAIMPELPEVSQLILFNPAVSSEFSERAEAAEVTVFHSREDQVVSFEAVEDFCRMAEDCELVAFDEGDHGFFNFEPALSETSARMASLLRVAGW